MLDRLVNTAQGDSVLNLLLDVLHAQYYHFAFEQGVDWAGGDQDELVAWACEHLRLVDANDAFARQNGFGSRADILEKGFLLSQMFSDRRVLEVTLRSALSLGERTADDVTRRMDAHGQVQYIRSIARLVQRDGLIEGLYGVQWDVTEEQIARQNLEAQNRQLQIIQSIGRLSELNLPIEDFMGRVADVIPTAMQYAEVAVAVVQFEGHIYGQKESLDAPCRIAYGIVVEGHEAGRIHIGYIEQRPFMVHESSYIRAVAERVTGYVTRVRAQARLDRLLTQVQQSEQLLRSIIDATPDWIFIKDQQHRYVLVNQGYANSLHTTPQDIVGKDDLELGFPEALVKGDPEQGIAGFWADDRAVMDGGESKIIPRDVVMVDSARRIYNTLKMPLRDAQGRVWGVLAFARDVSDREQLLVEAESLYEASRRLALATSLQDMVAAVMEGLRVPAINRAVLARFEYDQDGEMQAVVIDANWYSGEGSTPTPVGRRYDRSQFAMLQFLISPTAAFFDDTLNDERVDPNMRAVFQQQEIGTLAVLPLWAGARQLGVLALEGSSAYHLKESEVRSYPALMGQLAVTIENWVLLQAAESRAERERLARTAVERIRHGVDAEAVMRIGLEELSRILGTSRLVLRLGTSNQLQTLGESVSQFQIEG